MSRNRISAGRRPDRCITPGHEIGLHSLPLTGRLTVTNPLWPAQMLNGVPRPVRTMANYAAVHTQSATIGFSVLCPANVAVVAMVSGEPAPCELAVPQPPAHV